LGVPADHPLKKAAGQGQAVHDFACAAVLACPTFLGGGLPRRRGIITILHAGYEAYMRNIILVKISRLVLIEHTHFTTTFITQNNRDMPQASKRVARRARGQAVVAASRFFTSW